MTARSKEQIERMLLEVDNLLAEVTNHVKEAYIEVLDFKTHTFLNVEAFTEAKQRLNKLEMLYIKLKTTKEDYEEYSQLPTEDSI